MSRLLKRRESYCSIDWVIEFSIVSSYLGEVKVFSDNSNLTILWKKTVNELEYVSDGVYTCLKILLAIPHCFIKMFH